MNENEAIEQLQGKYLATNGKETPARVRYHNEALDTAIAALEEVQEYHATGRTPDMVRDLVKGYNRLRKVERTRWIPVNERLPEERDSIFAKFKGTDKWKTGMFEKTSGTVIVTVCSNDGSYRTTTAHTNDGKWKVNTLLGGEEVVAWMPLPEPYHVADSGKKVGDDDD